MQEFNQIIENIERDLNAERCLAALPTLLRRAEGDNSLLTRVHLLAARCCYVARDLDRYREQITLAKQASDHSTLEDQVRVSACKASLLTSSGEIDASALALEFASLNVESVSDALKALILSVQGRNYAMSGEYSEAIAVSQRALDLGEELATSSAFANGTISFVFGMMGRIVESEQFGLEQIRILTERGSGSWTGSLYSFLSACASSVQQWEKAHEYALQADASKGTNANPTLTLLWQANALIELGQSTESIRVLEQALASAATESSGTLLLNAHILYARALYMSGRFHEALTALQVPLNQSDTLGDNPSLELYKWLSKTYQALDRKAEAFDICYRMWELQTDFDNRTREALLSYHRALERKVHDQKVSIMNLKTAQMERELAMTATQLVAQTDLLGRFRNDLREIVRESRSDDPAMKKVKEKLKTLPCESIDWTRFESQFSTVHPEFKSKLEEKHSDLTRSEVKICALSRMKLTSEEIGRLLCLSDRTVQAHRFNIRKKLGLKTEDNLAGYLSTL